MMRALVRGICDVGPADVHALQTVAKGTKIVEVDPRNADAVYAGVGERPAMIAQGVLRAARTLGAR